MTITIYGLVDPRTNVLRYVGQAINPVKRHSRHCHPDKTDRTHRAAWIRNLLKRR
jgi:hypothetical protein